MTNEQDANVYYHKSFIANNSVSELDFPFNEKMGFNYEEHDDLIDVNKLKYKNEADSDEFPIEIDDMMRRLTELKEKGANYVSIESHGDHIGYDISGYAIRQATPEEIAEFNHKKTNKEAESKKQKIARLEAELIEARKA